MQEDLLAFVWKYRLFNEFALYNIESLGFEILSQGKQNHDAGPDFIGAKFKTSEAIWVGNVEIHLKSSDWNVHQHHHDKNYNNTILQVVGKHDKDVFTEDGRLLPVLEVKINELMQNKFHDFKNNGKWISCQDDIQVVDTLKRNIWLGNVLIQRLDRKSAQIIEFLNANKNNWEETFYILLARNFGFKINAEPFEWLAKSIPLNVLAKHKNSLLQIEALLFGQAGFLDTDSLTENYYLELKREYNFLKGKYNLKPIEKYLWKFLRLRPSNFPYIRISQFATLIYQSKSLFSRILEMSNISEIEKLFNTKASSFWDCHYTFEKKSGKRQKYLGNQSVSSILINTVIPIIFVYGKYTDNEDIKEKSLTFLEAIKAENNKITRGWQSCGLQITSAYYSQALIEQKNNYCNNIKCLNCGIGIEILKNQIK